VYCGRLDDPELLAAALLHDITEEFPRLWPYHRVETYSTKRVAELVHTCSIDRNWPYYNDNKEEYLKSYFEQIGRSGDALQLKLWDRIHNQLTLSACSVDRQCRKNRETERYLLPLALRHSILAEELEESIRETRSRLALVMTP
jgi:(p)ppGpp synthase/HD superfamily hydrolase